MTSVIWKYQLRDVRTTVEMPYGAKVLCVQLQEGYPTIWALVDPLAPKECRTFEVVGTGHKVDAAATTYIGTWQDDPFVWHLFELVYMAVRVS